MSLFFQLRKLSASGKQATDEDHHSGVSNLLLRTHQFLAAVKASQVFWVLQIVETGRESLAPFESEIELPRSGYNMHRCEPFYELMVEAKVRTRFGVMQGFDGSLVEKRKHAFRTDGQLVNEHAAIRVNAEYLKLISA